MAIVKCKECGSEISDKAKSCPKCGVNRPAPSTGGGAIVWVFVIVSLGIMMLLINLTKPDPAQTKKESLIKATQHKTVWNGYTKDERDNYCRSYLHGSKFEIISYWELCDCISQYKNKDVNNNTLGDITELCINAIALTMIDKYQKDKN